MQRAATPLDFGNYGVRSIPVIHERDPTCPDCKGKCTDKHGFDCRRCLGEGSIDE